MSQHVVQEFMKKCACVVGFLLTFLSVSCLARVYGQYYVLKQRDTKAMHPLFSRKGMSEVQCCIQCLHHEECRTVSYHASSQTCQLSSFPRQMAMGNQGWNLMARNYECPYNAMDFQQEGGRTLSACELLVPYHAAKTACGQFGELFKVESDADADTLYRFLSSRNLGMELFWVDGILNQPTGSWMLSDGSELLANSSVWAQSEPSKQGDCVMVYKSKKGSLTSAKCKDKISYVCEKL